MRERFQRTFKAFTYRDYRLLWAGAFTSSVGTWMQTVAQNWVILTITGSPFYLGFSSFLQESPFLALSLFGGVLADRYDRRRILLVSQVVQMASALLLAALLWKDLLTVWVILACAFVVGVAQSFGGPAYQALVPTLVDREDLPNAVALNSIQFNLARVIGPVLAGVAFYAFGAAACFALNGLSFLPVMGALLALRRGAPLPSSGAVEPVLASLKAGLASVRANRNLLGLVALSFCGSFLAMPLVTMLPVFAKDVFGQDAKGYSALLAWFGAGAVVGAIGVAGVIGKVERKGRLAVTMQMTFGALLLLFALSRVLAISYLLLFLCGGCLMIVFASFMTLVQTNVEESMRGRVVSVYTLAFRGAMPLGNLSAGALSSWAPAPWMVLAGNGAAMVAIGIAVFARRRRSAVLGL